MTRDPLVAVAELVEHVSGIKLEPVQHPALRAALGRAFPGMDESAVLRLASHPDAGAEVLAKLIDEVTIKETSVFRDLAQLESIDWHALRANAEAAGAETVRVWCVACATGEEAYSLALLAAEAFAPVEPPVRILATDISRSALAAAASALYRERSMRAVPAPLRNRYFTVAGDRLAVSERLRRLVHLAPHNLVSDPFPPLGEASFDLIICRNVLIYFDGELVEQVVADMDRALTPGGRLLLGAADALCGAERRLTRLSPGARAESTRTGTPTGALRRPLGREPEQPFAERLAGAVRAADEGRTAEALSSAVELVAEDALNPDLHFIRGLVELESGAAEAAVWSLRRALYLDPDFGLAAFKLGRAYEMVGDFAAARRSYEQTLRALLVDQTRHAEILAQVDVIDIAGACRSRLAALDVSGVIP